ncbi:hypothetical protein ACYFX5_18170 [Bremerella sp. T1]|uniref:hypothetical protein n=1 Tax=Bremerella sp. TYQ1 TaxID=3119568 RepID=UPI001CCD481A|nr:hypothetical protein [Bremerella volcania]UBM34982.1 hypothetical protein LA756_20125 [Bremerella volcania]
METQQLPTCPKLLSDDLLSPLKKFAGAWASSTLRPTPDATFETLWEQLILSWIADSNLPLFIRKASVGRGQVVVHTSGRKLIPVDNSPAQWVYSLALQGKCPTINEIQELINADRIPVAMILKSIERNRATYRYSLSRTENLNRVGWKLAHIEPIGLKKQCDLREIKISILKEHFMRFMHPKNMFLVPKSWAGLGEIPEMIDAIRAFRNRTNTL